MLMGSNPDRQREEEMDPPAPSNSGSGPLELSATNKMQRQTNEGAEPPRSNHDSLIQNGTRAGIQTCRSFHRASGPVICGISSVQHPLLGFHPLISAVCCWDRVCLRLRSLLVAVQPSEERDRSAAARQPRAERETRRGSVWDVKAGCWKV